MYIGPNNGAPGPVGPYKLSVNQTYNIPINPGQSTDLAGWSVTGTAGEQINVAFYL